MKIKNNSLYTIILTLVLASSLQSCMTTAKVKQAVAETNAAMLSPLLELETTDGKLDSPEGKRKLELAVHKLDTIMSELQNNEPVLNNLRVRKAMLYVRYGQTKNAQKVWSVVNETNLKSARDRAFYDTRAIQTWQYKHTKKSNSEEWNSDTTFSFQGLSPKPKLSDGIASYNKALSYLKEEGLRFHFSTLRVLLEYNMKSRWHKNQSDPEKFSPRFSKYCWIYALAEYMQEFDEDVLNAVATGSELKSRTYIRERQKLTLEKIKALKFYSQKAYTLKLTRVGKQFRLLFRHNKLGTINDIYFVPVQNRSINYEARDKEKNNQSLKELDWRNDVNALLNN